MVNWQSVIQNPTHLFVSILAASTEYVWDPFSNPIGGTIWGLGQMTGGTCYLVAGDMTNILTYKSISNGVSWTLVNSSANYEWIVGEDVYTGVTVQTNPGGHAVVDPSGLITVYWFGYAVVGAPYRPNYGYCIMCAESYDEGAHWTAASAYHPYRADSVGSNMFTMAGMSNAVKRLSNGTFIIAGGWCHQLQSILGTVWTSGDGVSWNCLHDPYNQSNWAQWAPRIKPNIVENTYGLYLYGGVRWYGGGLIYSTDDPYPWTSPGGTNWVDFLPDCKPPSVYFEEQGYVDYLGVREPGYLVELHDGTFILWGGLSDNGNGVDFDTNVLASLDGGYIWDVIGVVPDEVCEYGFELMVPSNDTIVAISPGSHYIFRPQS